MNGRERDDATRLPIAPPRTRRGAAAWLGGGALCGLFGRIGVADAACRRIGKACASARQCCGTPGTVACKRGRCRCAGGQFKDCNGDGRCEDLGFDRNNCGACGNRCATNENCFGSTCCRPVGGSCAAVCQPDSGCSACCTGFCDGVGTCQFR